jgi:hypothetical protein
VLKGNLDARSRVVVNEKYVEEAEVVPMIRT